MANRPGEFDRRRAHASLEIHYRAYEDGSPPYPPGDSHRSGPHRRSELSSAGETVRLGHIEPPETIARKAEMAHAPDLSTE
jgi:hypothetical protein